MGRKARSKAEREQEAPAQARISEQEEAGPLSGGAIDGLLILFAVITVAMVGLWFSLSVNRVFDVPKALALKVGGSGIFAAWIVRGVFLGGYPWRSIRLFLAPVLALLAAVGVSTLTSLDPWMSLYGVYERQFGFQGLMSCVGLFVVGATCLRSKRGAILGLSALSTVGGIVGTYSLLQAIGKDPYGFFKAPNTKVYATLGNATFAGNALALIFPISLSLGLVAVLVSFSRVKKVRAESGDGSKAALAVLAGFLIMLGLQLLPGIAAVSDAAMAAETRHVWYKFGVGLSVFFILAAGAMGSFGPEWVRLESVLNQRFADAMASGALLAMGLGQAIGLICTRTRGAWVGTGVAIIGGLLLLPKLFDDAPQIRRWVALACRGSLGSILLGGAVFLFAFPDHVYSRTIFSIPHAFNPDKTVYGQGQGTRRYLWTESPRVLFEHGLTLARQDRDYKDLVAHVVDTEPRTDREGSLLRKILVWPFGIGIETYRYAFMSHKSRKLEALDPMTNHDNPHNNYLYILASCGICGLLAYLWLLWRLISTAWKQFLGDRRPLIEVASRVTDTADGLRLELASPVAQDVVQLLSGSDLGGAGARAEGTKLVVLSGSTPEALRARLEKVGFPMLRGRADRALAFGVVTSFFSYAVYSIAGFDSVACSVFLFFLLGCTAVLFQPSGDEERRTLGAQLERSFHFGNATVFNGLALLMVPLLISTVIAGREIYRAEQAFVAEDARSMQDKLAGIEKAIEINPRESFYRQTLGSTYGDVARQYKDAALQAQRQGKTSEVQGYLARAQEYFRDGERALYAALDHAWAPENIFISLFQMYYSFGKAPEAAQALERALEHSPHLSPVRANLAVIKLGELNDPKGALFDCQWVVDVTPDNETGLRVCGQAELKLGDLAKAKDYALRAQARGPTDPQVIALMKELEAKTSSSSKAP